MAAVKPKSSTKSDSSSSKSWATAYLIFYNGIQTLGWSYLLFLLIAYPLGLYKLPNNTLYETVKWTVIIFQNAAALEVVHATIGIVPSNPFITFCQVASRVIVVCGVFMITKAGHESIGVPFALLAWSITEVIRYGNYTLNLLNSVPYFVKWLRYTTFIVLYPIGVTGELLCIYAAQKEVGETKILTLTLPNQFNFIFNYQYFLWYIMFLYLPLFPQMYLHMFAQRRKVIGQSDLSKTK